MNLIEVLNGTEQKFNQLACKHGEVNFAQECNHALYLLKENDYLKNIAIQNPESLKMAIYQLASVGLTLNPAKRQAYLVPYGGKKSKVTFIPGYIGLVHLALETGNLKWVKAELVYKGDDFKYKGPGEKPHHEFNPFSESRGGIDNAIGVYCVTKTMDGDYLVDMMSRKEVYSIRSRSESFKSGKKIGPWFSDEGEMWKKTVIRRAEKLWPKTKRLSEAVQILNENDGLLEEPFEEPETGRLEELKKIVNSIEGNTAERLIIHVNEKFKSEHDSIETFSSSEVLYSIEFLQEYAS